jgi:predicted DCC family thiol-disulfide oxidoreductase YuxK
MKTQGTKQIKKGDFIVVWDGHCRWVKRKVLSINSNDNGTNSYTVNIYGENKNVTQFIYIN